MSDPLKLGDLKDGDRLTCPKCGEQDFFKEFQLVAQTQTMKWDGSGGCYLYEEVEFDEVVRAEEIVCGACRTTIAVNDDTPDDRCSALVAAVERALVCTSLLRARRVLDEALRRYRG